MVEVVQISDTVGGASGGDGGGGGDDKEDHNGEKESMFRTPVKKKNGPKGSGDGDDEDGGATEDSSTASTAAVTTTAISATPTTTVLSLNSSDRIEIDVRRETLQHQMVLLSLLTTATLTVFVMTVVPLTILLAFGLFAISAGLLSYASFQRLLLEYQDIVAGDGFAQFLPASVMNSLTQMSLHEFMRDDTFVREWGFLSLYFVPGLTEEQLNDYILRLAPDRQVFLNRRGLGHLMGDGFMRIIVGDNRWRPEATTNISEHRQIVAVRSSAGLDLDSEGESQAEAEFTPVGLTVSSRLPLAPLPPPPPPSLSSPPPAETTRNPTPCNSTNQERRQQVAHETDVIMAAIYDGIGSLMNLGMGSASQFAREFARDQMVGRVGNVATYVGLASSVGATVMSVGAGLWRYSRPSSSSSGRGQSRAFSGFLFSTTVLGGLSTGVMLYARSALRQATRPPPQKPPGKFE